jgi:hypothetical protein
MQAPSPFSVQDEIQFWGRQIAEHNLFLYQGLVNGAIQEAKLKPIQLGNQSYNLREAGLVFFNTWNQALNQMTPVDQVVSLLQDTLNYQNQVLQTLGQGTWIGWLSYSFVEHIIMEARYFMSKLTGAGYQLPSEMDFWLWHNDTETAASVKLLDPTEVNLANQANQFINQTRQLRAQLLNIQQGGNLAALDQATVQNLNEFGALGNTLRTGILNHTIKSNITPTLINHIIREGNRATQIFQWLNQTQNPNQQALVTQRHH